MENKETVETPQFDPLKSYKWSKDTTFNFTGPEFVRLQMLLRDVVFGNVSFQSMLKTQEAFNIVQSKLKEAVEAGVATEATEEDFKELEEAQKKATEEVAQEMTEEKQTADK